MEGRYYGDGGLTRKSRRTGTHRSGDSPSTAPGSVENTKQTSLPSTSPALVLREEANSRDTTSGASSVIATYTRSLRSGVSGTVRSWQTFFRLSANSALRQTPRSTSGSTSVVLAPEGSQEEATHSRQSCEFRRAWAEQPLSKRVMWSELKFSNQGSPALCKLNSATHLITLTLNLSDTSEDGSPLSEMPFIPTRRNWESRRPGIWVLEMGKDVTHDSLQTWPFLMLQAVYKGAMPGQTQFVCEVFNTEHKARVVRVNIKRLQREDENEPEVAAHPGLREFTAPVTGSLCELYLP